MSLRYRSSLRIALAFATSSFLFFYSWSFSLEVQPSLKLTEGNGMGYKGYSTVGLFLSSDFELPFQIFLDNRIHYFNDDQWGANSGLGFRYENSYLKKILGFNVFYDFRQSDRNASQIGLGLEVLGTLYDFRINGYLPLGSTIYLGPIQTYSYPGGYFVTCREFQKLLKGVDAEIETSLNHWGHSFLFDFFIAVGPHYYQTVCDNHFIGGQLRCGIRYFDLITAELKVNYDSTFGTNVQGSFAIHIPFGGYRYGDYQDRAFRMSQSVQRQEIPIITEKSRLWTINY